MAMGEGVNAGPDRAVVADASVFGDIAFVQGVGFEKSTTNGKDTSKQWRYMEIYAKRDGRWQCVSTHSTRIAAGA